MILTMDCRHGLAILEGFQFVGFELDPQYTAIANARLEAARNAAG